MQVVPVALLLGRRNRSRHANACCTNGRWQGVVSDADLARYDAMAEALLAPDLAYHLLLAGLCRRTESQEFRTIEGALEY